MKSESAWVEGDGLRYQISGRVDDPITIHHTRMGTFYEQYPLRRMSRLAQRTLERIDSGYIIDAGANIGNHTLYLAGSNPSARVYAFEMNPLTYGYLKQNVHRSELKNINIYNYGLSSALGQCGVKQNSDNPLGGAQLDFGKEVKQEVELVTLDHFIAEKHILNRCVLIKMDVEGHEYEVLKGAKRLIGESSPMVYAELKEIEEFKKISTFLFSMGYTIAYAEDGALPNFLFVHRKDLSYLFTDQELEEIKTGLCLRIVEAWQLHRLIKRLKSQ